MIKYKLEADEGYGEIIKRLFPEEFIEEKSKAVGVTFQITDNCCMACTYCYQHNKGNNRMSFNTAKIIIDKLLNDELYINRYNTVGVYLDFIGGEALMEIDLIEQIWVYYYSQLLRQKHPWLRHAKMNICSNGLLYLSPKVQKFFKKYNSLISFTISVDGNKELHDACRIDLNGNGTYDRVIQGVQAYYKVNRQNPATKMTLSPDNIQYLFNSIKNLIKEKYKYINLNCIFEQGWNYDHALTMYQELKKIADFIIDNNYYDKIYISLFQEQNFEPIPERDNGNWCGGIGDNMLSFDYLGNMYPCIRYMDSSLNSKQSPIIVGNIYSGYLQTEIEKKNFNLVSNISRRSQSTDECYFCPIARGCSWCSAYNYEEFGTPNKRTTYTCCMHQATSLANVYYWNKLYQKLNIDKKFIMYIPKEWALKIIDEKEYNYLLNLSQEDE